MTPLSPRPLVSMDLLSRLHVACSLSIINILQKRVTLHTEETTGGIYQSTPELHMLDVCEKS